MGHLKKQQGPSAMSRKPSFSRLSLRCCHIQMIHSVAWSNGSSGCGSFPSPKWYRRRKKCRASRLQRGSASWWNCTHRKRCWTCNSMPVDLQTKEYHQDRWHVCKAYQLCTWLFLGRVLYTLKKVTVNKIYPTNILLCIIEIKSSNKCNLRASLVLQRPLPFLL